MSLQVIISQLSQDNTMGWIMFLFLWSIAALIVFKLYVKLTTGWCKSNVCLVGKTAIVTGGNSGIGYETAADFAKRGAKVILACRNITRGNEAVKKIIESTNNPHVIFKQLDLCSLKSVREFATDVFKSEQRLDILVNNAGIAYTPEVETKDGLGYLMQANYFGHFLLTNLLLDILKRTKNSRIVNVSSIAARIFVWYTSPFDLNELDQQPPKGPRDGDLYGKSKLCNILFTIELAERLKGTTVTTYSLHPGVVLTNIFSSLSYMGYVFEVVIKWLFKDSVEGAQTTIYCSVEKDIEELSGQHFHDCHVVGRYKTALDPSLPKKLWKLSEKLVKLNQK